MPLDETQNIEQMISRLLPARCDEVESVRDAALSFGSGELSAKKAEYD